MAETLSFVDVIEELAAKGRLTADDVLYLRRQVFPDGVVDRQEADVVFELDHACAVKDSSWTQFYVDALTDFYLWQSDPRGYMSEEQARELIDHVACDGRIARTSELELLLNIVHWATWVPESLSLMALKAVRESVLDPQHACFGGNRPPTVISPADVAILRKVVYAPGSPGGFTVTRQEADLLYDLKIATDGEENAPAWRDFFVKAIGSHLLFPRRPAEVPDAETARKRNAWLEERRGIGHLMAAVGKSVVTLDVPLGEAWREVDIFGTEAEKAEREKEEARLKEAFALEVIDAEEAAWLCTRLHHDAAIDEDEKALLAFIKENARAIDPDLRSIMDEVGI